MRKSFAAFFFLVICFSLQSVHAQPEKPIEPQAFLIFGGTGDLAQKKLYPALFSLFIKDKLPEQFVCLGIAKSSLTEVQFQELIFQSLKSEFASQPNFQDQFQKFSSRCFYYALDFSKLEDFYALEHFLKQVESEHGTLGNRLFYLSTPPSFFTPLGEMLAKSGLSRTAASAWVRVILEKPFGRDLASALELREKLLKTYKPSQLYLIDHFLGKELVQNLLTLRFFNPVFSRLWKHEAIEHVQVTVSEDIGIGSRGKFWEETGMLRDIIQNHVMQMIALVAMEPPAPWESEAIRAQKIKVLQQIRPFEDLEKNPVRGQYGPGKVKETSLLGYRDESDVASTSFQETFVAAKLYIDNDRWRGVPFYIRAGKRLSEKRTEIVIQFKKDLFIPADTHAANQLVIRVQPNEEIYMRFNSKYPGKKEEIISFAMRFNYQAALEVKIPEAYETLLKDAMIGEAELFVDPDEILASWKVFDPVLNYWHKNPPNSFPNYSAGSWGPQEADQLLEKSHTWN